MNMYRRNKQGKLVKVPSNQIPESVPYADLAGAGKMKPLVTLEDIKNAPTVEQAISVQTSWGRECSAAGDPSIALCVADNRPRDPKSGEVIRTGSRTTGRALR